MACQLFVSSLFEISAQFLEIYFIFSNRNDSNPDGTRLCSFQFKSQDQSFENKARRAGPMGQFKEHWSRLN